MERKKTLCLAKVRFSVFILVILTAELSLGHDSPRARCKLVPDAWTPSLEQVQEDVEENLAAQPNQSQQALNRGSQNMADLADARLFIAYVSLMQRLDEKERNKLFNEQKRWLAQRVASARAAVVSKGGSLEALEYASASFTTRLFIVGASSTFSANDFLKCGQQKVVTKKPGSNNTWMSVISGWRLTPTKSCKALSIARSVSSGKSRGTIGTSRKCLSMPTA